MKSIFVRGLFAYKFYYQIFKKKNEMKTAQNSLYWFFKARFSLNIDSQGLNLGPFSNDPKWKQKNLFHLKSLHKFDHYCVSHRLKAKDKNKYNWSLLNICSLFDLVKKYLHFEQIFGA